MMGDLIWYAMLGVIVALVVATAVLAWRLHQAGVGNAALPGQVALKGADWADQLRDRVVQIMAEESARLVANARLRAAYFDQQDFVADVGRLPAGYKAAVTLDGKLVRNGDLPADVFVTDAATGNVKRA